MASPNVLDQLLPPEKQVHYHGVMKCSSLFTGIIPDDPAFKTRQFCLYKYLIVFFLFCVNLRIFVECFLPENSVIFLYLGDFKIWWGDQYLVNQVVFAMAVIVVPFYQFINLKTICPRDYAWVLPFKFCEGLKTPREIKLQDDKQVKQLLSKMKANFYRAHATMISVWSSYTVGVFVSFYLFYDNYVQVFTLGIFWTLFESTWTKTITQNMGIYSACFEVIIYYLHLRFDKIRDKLSDINRELGIERKGRLRACYLAVRIRRALCEVDDINADLQHYNHYWRKYIMAVFISYLPQILFELYVCLFISIQTSVLVFSIILIVNITTMMSQICIFSANLICKMHSIKNTLNSIYIRLFLVGSALSADDSVSGQPGAFPNNNEMLLLRLKLSHFLEQYSCNRVGFFLFDYHILDWQFYCNTVINCSLYFFLIVDFLR